MWLKKSIVGFLLITAVGCTPPASSDEPAILDSAVPEIEENPITWTDCGGNVGDHGCDFTFEDQSGDEWNLYDHHGTVMVLDFSAIWCYYCRVAADEVQAVQDLYGDQDFLWVTILVDNAAGDPPTAEDINNWVATYGITTAPVLAGNRISGLIDTTAENGYPVSSWPTFVIVDRDLVIQYGLHGWSEEIIMDWILDTLEE